jgi:hypothetical protein
MMSRLIRRLERVKPYELSDGQFIGICLFSLAAALYLVFSGSTLQ